MTWLVGRFEPGDMPWSMVEEFAAYIRSLGLDPTHMSVRAAVVQGKDGYELHLMRHVLNAEGTAFINAAMDDVVMESVIVPVEEDSWPEWLRGMRCGPRPATVELRSDGTELGDTMLAILRRTLLRRQGYDPEV